MAVDISNMLSNNVIIIDSDYIDNVASDFSKNFENMLNRQIPKADLPLWLDCISLDAGIEPGKNDIQTIFIYSSNELKSFSPSKISEEIDGKAFIDNLGEFTMEAYKVEQDVTTIGDQFADTISVLLNAESVKKILIIPNMELYGEKIKRTLEENKDKDVVLFSILPQAEQGFTCQQLGFSVLHALGIRGEEFQD